MHDDQQHRYLQFGPFIFDSLELTVTKNGITLPFERRHYDILKCLIENRPEKVRCTDTCLSETLSSQPEINEKHRLLTKYLSELRGLMGKTEYRKYIRNTSKKRDPEGTGAFEFFGPVTHLQISSTGKPTTLTEAINPNLSSFQNAVIGANRKGGAYDVPLIEHLDIKECLIRLGCTKDLLSSEEAIIRNWLGQRVSEPLWRSEGPALYDALKERGESAKACSAVDAFVQHLVYCCAPRHGSVSSFYLSIRKVSEAYRMLQGEMQVGNASDLSPEGQVISVHNYLLSTNRLAFLPARLLLGGALPNKDDELFYFTGLFTFTLDDRDLAKIPGGLKALSSKSTDFAVTSFFANPDPSICPILKFSGHLREFPVTMSLSRKYVRFSSVTAAILPMVLSKKRLELRGIGAMRHNDDLHELHPLACGF